MNKGRNHTVAFKKSPTILRHMKLPLFRACTIRLSDILITELLWTIQTAAKHSEGSQMGKIKDKQNQENLEKARAGRSANEKELK